MYIMLFFNKIWTEFKEFYDRGVKLTLIRVQHKISIDDKSHYYDDKWLMIFMFEKCSYKCDIIMHFYRRIFCNAAEMGKDKEKRVTGIMKVLTI